MLNTEIYRAACNLNEDGVNFHNRDEPIRFRLICQHTESFFFSSHLPKLKKMDFGSVVSVWKLSDDF